MHEFTHLKSWGKSLDGGGLDSWNNFIAREDHNWYYRHAIVYGYAPDAGIPSQESEFKSILTHLQETDPDNVIESSMGHWTYSSFDLILVRLFDDSGAPTEAALAADEVLRGLEDYPVFNEEAVSEAEYEAAYEYFRDSGCLGISEEYVEEIFSAFMDTSGDYLDSDGSIYVRDTDLQAAQEEVFQEHLPPLADPDFLTKAEALAEALGMDSEAALEPYTAPEGGVIDPRWSSPERWAAKLAAFLAGERIGARPLDLPWPA